MGDQLRWAGRRGEQQWRDVQHGSQGRGEPIQRRRFRDGRE